MFNAKQQLHDVYTISTIKNEWNEDIKTPVLLKQIYMFISLITYNNYTTNNVNLQSITHIGITADKTLEKGMLIDNGYEVEFVNNAGKDSIIYLKQVV